MVQTNSSYVFCFCNIIDNDEGRLWNETVLQQKPLNTETVNWYQFGTNVKLLKYENLRIKTPSVSRH